ncbi:MAG: dihydrolipoyllysine-residue acetyltransferase [Calditrichaceae bacterium]|nr:dihydrolipoyllysine-residue acetyltransferase [Calditrichaceae bacterium]
MTVEIKLPELGENIESGRVVGIMASAGDKIEKDQILMELETDKAVVEVPADKSGTIEDIRVNEGDDVKVGQTLVTIRSDETAGNESVKADKDKQAEQERETQKKKSETENVSNKKNADEKKQAKPVKESSDKKQIVEFKIPELGENIESGSVAGVLVSVGDSVAVDQGLIELETDKAVAEVPSEMEGVVKEILIKAGDQVKVGQTVMKLETESGAIADEKSVPDDKPQADKPAEDTSETKEKPAKKELSQPAQYNQPRDPNNLVPAAPSVRRFAREIGIDIHDVPGSGRSGHISVEDIKRYSKSLNKQSGSAPALSKGVEAEALPDFSKWGEVDPQPMSKVRETTAKHLSYAWATIPHVTQHDKADITELEKLRKRFAKHMEEAGGKLTVTAILIKVIEYALKKFPQFNASVDMGNNKIIYKKYYNIGIAADTDRGLLVPVIKNVDQKNIIQISVELTELSKKARDRKLSLEEMQGGNFSISNLGGIGGTAFTPVVNSPEVAILGVSRSAFEPVYIDGEFKPRLMLPLSLSYDHRIIDGADAARFLRWVCEILEQPFLLSLED